jgi:hypothetical protein
MHDKRGVGKEMNSVNASQSEKKLVDVTGIEPVTPCLQSRTIAYNGSLRFL